jgi:hypothetical protein
LLVELLAGAQHSITLRSLELDPNVHAYLYSVEISEYSRRNVFTGSALSWNPIYKKQLATDYDRAVHVPPSTPLVFNFQPVRTTATYSVTVRLRNPSGQTTPGLKLELRDGNGVSVRMYDVTPTGDWQNFILPVELKADTSRLELLWTGINDSLDVMYIRLDN